MGKKLVIVESPAKAKTINRLLGSEYTVKSSMGHVRDLPLKSLGVDIKDSFKPRYVNVKGRKKTIDELKKASETCDVICLATDPDREGEAIAWHLKAILEQGGDSKDFFRVQYNEVTPRAVRKAFENPTKLDMNRVNAQQARRILDRIVGYMVSPILWRRLRQGLSAGRVQSVALRLVCEREAEIRGFVPEEYWLFGATVRKLVAPLDPFHLKLARIDGEKAEIKSADQAKAVREDLQGRSLQVADVAVSEIARRPPPPFITSTLQQAGSNLCRFSPARTMSIAQKLYEGVDLGDGPVGLITYMRTDSFRVSEDALRECRDLIEQRFGDEYRPAKPNFFKSRESAQEAHEAIRPTDARRAPDSLAGTLDANELRIYRIIWERFVASQMAPARIALRTVTVDAPPKSDGAKLYTFRATVSEVRFPGYMKLTGTETKEKTGEADDDVEYLPDLSAGERLECVEWLEERKETRPPPRYSEASLIRILEKNGVGRPSTYAQTITTLCQRKYARSEKRTLFPTDLGIQVSTFLVTDLSDLFNVEFTAAMEESLDKIESGQLKWTDMLADFYEKFERWTSKARAPSADRNMTARLLAAFKSVKEWTPEVKRGKKIYSDNKFVESIAKRLENGDKDISQRQLETLARIAAHYRKQVPEFESLISEAGLAAILDEPEPEPPRPETLAKFNLLEDMTLEEPVRNFVASLRSRVDAGRNLSEAQSRALDSIVVSHSDQIANFAALKSELGIEGTGQADNEESARLIDALSRVREWNPSVKRGRKVFDDKKFFESLSEHFSKRGFLSFRQRIALKKMAQRYRVQGPKGGDGAGTEEGDSESN